MEKGEEGGLFQGGKCCQASGMVRKNDDQGALFAIAQGGNW